MTSRGLVLSNLEPGFANVPVNLSDGCGRCVSWFLSYLLYEVLVVVMVCGWVHIHV